MRPKLLLLLLSVILYLSGCHEDDETITDVGSVAISGHIQKGPFINGTNLTITELDNSLAATGKTFTTQITDNRGSFFIKTSRLDYPNLQLIATGFYFDEVQGEKSAAQLTLFALANVSADAIINVNVLSHLEKDRILYLIEQNMGFLEAKQQAQREILAIFGIERDNMANSELLDITQAGEENAILLAVSAVLQSGNTVAELSELLAEIITDIREDGVLDNEPLKAALRQNAINLDLPKVRQNLTERYQELGLEVTIPDFEQFVDSDGDGVLNKDDDNLPDEFDLVAVENAMRNTVYQSGTVVISGLPYPAIARVTQGKLIKNGQPTQDKTTYVQDGDSLSVALLASTNWNETLTTTLWVGDYRTDFSVQVQPYSWATTVTGVAQQGPFVNGSAVSLTEVDSTLTNTNRVVTSKTTNSQGEYAIGGIEHHYPWAKLQATGYYFNLVEGATSDSELTLVGYIDISSAATAHVNVLTHLEHRRVKYLVNNGLSFTAAKQQALREVLAVFEIKEAVSVTAEQFNITQDTPEGAMLLAISAMLQGYESTGTLQELLTNISEDLETDGTLDNGNWGSSLINNAVYSDLNAIRTATISKYQELGKPIAVADFESYVTNFKANTDFTFTRPIIYPKSTNFGDNILNDSNASFKDITDVTGSNYTYSYYSLSADVPEDGRLKIVLKGGLWYLTAAPAPINWSAASYNQSLKSQVFTVSRAGSASDYKICFPQDQQQTITIEYYEFGSATPTKTRTITVTP